MKNNQLARLRDFRNELIPSWFSDDIDVMFRDFFNSDSFFAPLVKSSINYPVDIHETEKDLNIEIAVAGLDKQDITIEEEDGILRVSYNKDGEVKDEGRHYFCKSIAKRSFNFGWKLEEDKFDLKQINAEMDKGLLKITIPKFEEDKKPVPSKNTISIK